MKAKIVTLLILLFTLGSFPSAGGDLTDKLYSEGWSALRKAPPPIKDKRTKSQKKAYRKCLFKNLKDIKSDLATKLIAQACRESAYQ